MVEVVLFDIDGVLTDGAVYVDAEGREQKRILFDDIDAVFAFRRAGVRVGFISGEDTPFCSYVRKRFEPDYFLSGCKDKLAGFATFGLAPDRVLYVGDSAKDAPLLRHVAESFAPADAVASAREAAKVVLTARRGQGVIREVAERVLANRGEKT